MKGKDYKKFAAQIRLETVKQIGKRGFGHIGGSLSIADVLSVLYGGIMKINPQDPDWDKRDKLVVSKGHSGPGLYAALALKGYFPIEWLDTLNQPNTHLPSHCDRLLTPGVDMTTGSLGQGVSTAIGLAIAQRKKGYDSYTYLITGDGELDEGQCWEGALFAPSQRIDNLIWFVDNNHKQLDGKTEEVIDLRDIAEKFRSFGWYSLDIDGSNPCEIESAILEAKSIKGQPSCIVLNTIKGAGVPCVANIEMNHHMTMTSELLKNAIAECEATLSEVQGEIE